MSRSPLVSVIVPTFNRESTIRRALDSVFGQEGPALEVIVVDDGSTDRTVDRLAPYGTRLSIIRQPNRGTAVARNTGIERAKGDFIAFLDSDDEWLPGKLAAQLRVFAENPAVGLVSSGARYVSGAGDCVEVGSFRATGDLFDTLLFFNPVVVSSVVVRASVIRGLPRLFREGLGGVEDWELWLRLSGRCDFAIRADPFVAYHQTADGVWRRRSAAEKKVSWRAALDGLRDDPVVGDRIRRRWHAACANLDVLAALDLYASGLRWEARREAAKAFLAHPFAIRWLPTASVFLAPSVRGRLARLRHTLRTRTDPGRAAPPSSSSMWRARRGSR